MSEDEEYGGTDWESVVGWIIFFLLILLFAGEPDIHDGIIRWLMK